MATKVFISWSGDLSKKLADAVQQWLPSVLQFVKPYFTPDDIEKGARWSSDITNELSASDLGIICLTKENLDKPWILFEAGALSKNFDKAHVCTLLFNVKPTDLEGPLSMFQSTMFIKEDFKKLVKDINSSGSDSKLDDSTFDKVFEMWWPQLEEQVSIVLNEHVSNGENELRDERDMLEELIELARLNSRFNETHKVLPTLDPASAGAWVLPVLELVARSVLYDRFGDSEAVSRKIRAIDRYMLFGSEIPELFRSYYRTRSEESAEFLRKQTSSNDEQGINILGNQPPQDNVQGLNILGNQPPPDNK